MENAADPSMMSSRIEDRDSKKKLNLALLIIIIFLGLILAFLAGYLISKQNSDSDNSDTSTESEMEEETDESDSDLETEEDIEDEADEDEGPTAEWQTVNFQTVSSELSTIAFDFTYKQPVGDFNQNGDNFIYHTASGANYELQFEVGYEAYPTQYISVDELDVHPQFGNVYRALSDIANSHYVYSTDEQLGSGLDCTEEPFTADAPCGTPAVVFDQAGFKLSCTAATSEGVEICDLIVSTIEVEGI